MSITNFKKAYPNLNQEQLTLLNACRIATEWSKYTSSLKKTRTLGTDVLRDNIDVKHFTSYIENADQKKLSQFKDPNMLHYLERKLPDITDLNVKGIHLKLNNPAIVACRNVGYHADSVDCDTEAYIFVFLSVAKGAKFVYGGNAYDVNAGDAFVFDARIPHALVDTQNLKYNEKKPGDLTYGLIASTDLTPEIASKLGILTKGVPKDLSKLDAVEKIEIDDATGAFNF